MTRPGSTSDAGNKNAQSDNPSGGLQLRLHQCNSPGNSSGAVAKNKRQSCDTLLAPKSTAQKRGSSLPRWMFWCFYCQIWWLDTSFIHRNIRASQALSFSGLPSLDLVHNDSSERKSRHKSAGNSKDSIWRMKNLQKWDIDNLTGKLLK